MLSLKSIFHSHILKSQSFYYYNETTEAHALMWYEAVPLSTQEDRYHVEQVTRSWDLFTGKRRVFEQREMMINFDGGDVSRIFNKEQASQKLLSLENMTSYERKDYKKGRFTFQKWRLSFSKRSVQ